MQNKVLDENLIVGCGKFTYRYLSIHYVKHSKCNQHNSRSFAVLLTVNFVKHSNDNV